MPNNDEDFSLVPAKFYEFSLYATWMAVKVFFLYFEGGGDKWENWWQQKKGKIENNFHVGWKFIDFTLKWLSWENTCLLWFIFIEKFLLTPLQQQISILLNFFQFKLYDPEMSHNRNRYLSRTFPEISLRIFNFAFYWLNLVERALKMKMRFTKWDINKMLGILS